MTVQRGWSRNRSRAGLVIPPPAMQRNPASVAASNPVQNPRNGPNEKGKKILSRAVSPMNGKLTRQQPSSHSHDSGVSSHRSGWPVLVPEVWCIRQ